MFDPEFLKFNLIGNVEGIGAAFLTYIMFKMIIPVNELESGKSTLISRLYRAIIYILFYASIICLFLTQGPENAKPVWPIVDFWLALYTAVSFGLFYAWPVIKKALAHQRN